MDKRSNSRIGPFNKHAKQLLSPTWMTCSLDRSAAIDRRVGYMNELATMTARLATSSPSAPLLILSVVLEVEQAHVHLHIALQLKRLIPL
jgi:hypothetical protein